MVECVQNIFSEAKSQRLRSSLLLSRAFNQLCFNFINITMITLLSLTLDHFVKWQFEQLWHFNSWMRTFFVVTYKYSAILLVAAVLRTLLYVIFVKTTIQIWLSSDLFLSQFFTVRTIWATCQYDIVHLSQRYELFMSLNTGK